MSFECIKAGLRWRVSWLFIGLAGVLGVGFGARCLSPIVNGPTYLLRDLTIIHPKIEQGESLLLQVHAAVAANGQCTGYVIREFWRTVIYNGREIKEKFRSPLSPPPIPEPNGTSYLLIIPTSMSMVPDHWIFKGRTTLDCGFFFGGITYFDTAEIPFEIIPKISASQ